MLLNYLSILELKLDTTMINAMLRSGSPRNALLVLSFFVDKKTEDTNTPAETDAQTPSATNDSSLDVADKLKLCNISCPWQVRIQHTHVFLKAGQSIIIYNTVYSCQLYTVICSIINIISLFRSVCL